MRSKVLYEFYLDGYQNGKDFWEVPTFNGQKSIIAYTKGFEHAENNRPKLDLYQFSKIVLGEIPKQYATIQQDW